MSNTLAVVARIEAHPDKIELLKAQLCKLVAPTLNELGCMQYDLHQDNRDAAVFLFYERWQTRELWQEHMKTDHVVQYGLAAKGLVASFVLNEMTIV